MIRAASEPNAAEAASPTDEVLAPAYRNGGWWELGNGLARSTLVIYLAKELGADGIAVACILASQHFAGLLRLAAPSLLRLWPRRQAFAITFFCLSSVLLMALPVVAHPSFLGDGRWSLTALVLLWAGWHAALYLGFIALLDWFRDLVPTAIRGTFLGRREAWKMAGAIIGAVAAGVFAWGWSRIYPKETHWLGLALPFLCGGIVTWWSNASLLDLPEPPRSDSGSPGVSLRVALADRSFRRFLAFACWGAFANGVTQAAVGLFAPVALKVPALVVLSLESAMRLGQSWSAPRVGALLDRWGNRQVLVVSLLSIAAAMLAYFPASPTQWWWLSVVYVLFVGYVGLNVALPNALLKITPPQQGPRYIAVYYAATGLAVGIGAIVGGIAFELIGRRWQITLPVVGWTLDRFRFFFLIGLALRFTAVLPLWNWRELDGDGDVNGARDDSARG